MYDEYNSAMLEFIDKKTVIVVIICTTVVLCLYILTASIAASSGKEDVNKTAIITACIKAGKNYRESAGSFRPSVCTSENVVKKDD